MEKKEILAEFHDGITFDESGVCTDPNHHYSWRPGCYDRLRVDNLQYDSSWNWFHPVWEKFRDLKFEVSDNAYRHSQLQTKIAKKIAFSTLPEAFEELVRGVIWYNSIKEK